MYTNDNHFQKLCTQVIDVDLRILIKLMPEQLTMQRNYRVKPEQSYTHEHKLSFVLNNDEWRCLSLCHAKTLQF